jgi:hypothetical protein
LYTKFFKLLNIKFDTILHSGVLRLFQNRQTFGKKWRNFVMFIADALNALLHLTVNTLYLLHKQLPVKPGEIFPDGSANLVEFMNIRCVRKMKSSLLLYQVVNIPTIVLSPFAIEIVL